MALEARSPDRGLWELPLGMLQSRIGTVLKTNKTKKIKVYLAELSRRSERFE